MIQEAIAQLVGGGNLSRDEARNVMEQIMTGGATDAQIGAFLISLRCSGETVPEIAGCAQVMREKAVSISTSREPIVDTCGTGGDGSGTFNISTTVAFVAAGAGLCVAKHGNRAMSSKCGSADVLQALGVNVEASPERVGECMDKAGIGFLFAPMLHGAMKHAIGPRREIGTRTVFNVLGPLTNPAGARRQLIGVYDQALTSTLAEVLQELGSDHAYVVHGSDGMDEITITGSSQVSELDKGAVSTYQVTPEEFGMQVARADAIRGGDAEENAQTLRQVLTGTVGPQRDVVLLNAAAAIAAGGDEGGVQGLKTALERARESIDSGKALAALDGLVRISNG